ncbi:Hypothetical protein, putative [Bodo saltans]|uniref:Uncharacterized protein n=1 Tax=Bodo saltans TaxID=75058 RepID=A0A0S4JM02_BODSA|nr:Hypothetical protein, putative [Bodo saltans]|eukprot:CUG91419.1 Hypothetical protein, putative [Bodo saltans]
MPMRQPSEVNIVQPQSPPPPPPPLVHTAPVLLVPTTDPVSYRSRSSTSSVPLSPLELPGGSNRGPSTASAASSKVDARCFTRDEKQQGRGNSSFASTVASTTASTSAPPPGRSGQLSSTAPPSPTLLASTSRPTMNTQQQHRTQTGAAINAASFSSPPQHDRNTFSGGSVIDESPLIVPRRRRGAAASSTTSTAAPLLHHQSPHITTGVATGSTATFVARTTASSISSAVAAPLMQHSGAWNTSDSKAYASDGRRWHHSILVDDATQSSETGGGGSGTPPSNNGLLRGFPQRDIGDIVLEPPQSESPKLLRYLADTRNALAMIPPTLSSRRGSPLPQTNQRFPFELNRTTEPSGRFSVSPNPTVVGGSYNTATTTQDSRPFEDDVVFVVKREGSPLRWQKRSAPSHTTFTTSVRHDDTDEDCISDLSSGDDDENSMMRMAPQRKVLFSGGSSVSGGRLRSPVW